MLDVLNINIISGLVVRIQEHGHDQARAQYIYHNIARALVLFNSYCAIMNEISTYARPCVYKMTPAISI